MAQTIYNALELIFGGGLAADLSDWMTTLFGTVLSLLDGGSLFTTAMTVFAALACTMLTLFFFMELVSQANRELFSLEKLIVMFVKFLTGFVVLLVLPDIVVGLARIGNYLYLSMKDGPIADALLTTSDAGLSFTFGGTEYASFPDWASVSTAFEDQYSSIFKAFGTYIECLILNFLGWIVKFAGYFVCTQNAVMILARAIFMPVAVVQCFEDGSRSSGIRYIKAFAAECITMAIIIVLIYAASTVSGGLMSNQLSTMGLGTTVTFDNMDSVIQLKNTAVLLIPQFVAVGGMAGGGKLTREILGA